MTGRSASNGLFTARSPPAGAPSTGYFQTAGLANGIPAVNGDPTHNRFSEPGAAGTFVTYQVAERLTNGAEVNALICLNCTVASIINGAGDSPFQIRYAANLTSGDSVINITNTGANGASLA